MKASEEGYINKAELLLKYKADVNLQSKVSAEGNRERRGKECVRVLFCV